ncbi:MAG TPA: DUF4157 domain-containing protein [Terriglobia bacterium]|nr:DUF4157 domain-containing protein [Terriglobia bacterium]
MLQRGNLAKPDRALQRAAVSPTGPASIPPLVNGVLSEPGRPLDSTVRGLLEPRFGHDFSGVRVHADTKAAESARQVGALAYTVGQDLVFAQDQYRPHNGPGRMLIAHELAHTIQQGPGSVLSSQDSAGEREADNAAFAALFNRPVRLSSAAVPAIQFTKVSSGAFGKALEMFTDAWSIPDEAVTLLRKSPTFMKVVALIEANYVFAYDFFNTVPPDVRPMPGPGGRIQKDPFKGKRVLFEVVFGNASFRPFGTPPEPGVRMFEGDVIAISERTSIPGFISEIAHEATHAARFVGASAPPAKTIVDEVNAFITDEIETRKSEEKILGEIPDKDVKARASQVGSRDPARVERDLPPATNLTYLETVFFSVRLREAKAKDGISEEEAEAIREKVDKDMKSKTAATLYFKPRVGPLGTYELSDYGEIWFRRSVAQREWEAFKQAHQPSDPDFTAAKDKLAQDHAKRFFEGRVSYKPLLIDI